MTSYWPTPGALKNDPVVADRMNTLPKVVFGVPREQLQKGRWDSTLPVAQTGP
jgi:hypothetical protein